MRKGEGYLLSALFIQLTTAAIPLHHGFTCKESPAGITGFTPANFEGTWYMQKSTMYNKEKFGCLTWTLGVNKDDSENMMGRFSYMKTFDWNLLYYETGIPHAERQSFSFDDTGKLSNTGLLGGYQ